MWLAARALLAFLVLPGIVAFLIPSLIAAVGGRAFNLLGLALLGPGTVLLLWTVAAFWRRGRGTLAPWDPPRSLVVTGIYGLSRNPMYVAVVLILCGWALAFESWLLALYAAVVALAFHLRVVYGEEPWLSKRYGEAWTQYSERVPRWLGGTRPVRRRARAAPTRSRTSSRE